jgi:hypothetical protein
MTLRNVFGNERITSHPFGWSSWILIAGYFASNCGNWIKSSSEHVTLYVLETHAL